MNASSPCYHARHYEKTFNIITKSALAILVISLIFLLNSCFLEKTYKPLYTEDGDGKLPINSYTFNRTMTEEEGKTLDTSAYYLQIFDVWSSNIDQRSNPMIMKFEQSGYFRKDAFKYYQKFNKIRTHESVNYGGKFYLDSNKIYTEEFYPNGQVSQRYVRKRNTGTVKGDTIFMVYYQHKSTFVKKSYEEIFKDKELKN